jgi:hypothetical protein
MTQSMRLTVLGALFAASLLANSVNYTYTAQTYGDNQQSCGPLAGACSPFELAIPPFDPSLGTVGSITFTFTDVQSVLGGLNDVMIPWGTAFPAFTDTEGDSAPLLDLNVSASQQITCVVGTSCGLNEDDEGLRATNNLVISGTLTGAQITPFIGSPSNGAVEILVMPFLEDPGIVQNSSDQYNLWVSLFGVSDQASLTLTYKDSTASAVPEPRWISGVVLGVLVLIGLGRSYIGAFSMVDEGQGPLFGKRLTSITPSFVSWKLEGQLAGQPARGQTTRRG